MIHLKHFIISGRFVAALSLSFLTLVAAPSIASATGSIAGCQSATSTTNG